MHSRELILVRAMGQGHQTQRYRAIERYGSHRRPVYLHVAVGRGGAESLDRLARAWSSSSSPLRAAMRPSIRSGERKALLLDHPGGVPVSALLRHIGPVPVPVALRIVGDIILGSHELWATGREGALDAGLVHLRDNGQLVLVGLPCPSEGLKLELLALLLGADGDREALFRALCQGGCADSTAEDLMDMLGRPLADIEALTMFLRALAQDLGGASRESWAAEVVPQVQRRLPPAAVDPVYGRTVDEHLGADLTLRPMRPKGEPKPSPRPAPPAAPAPEPARPAHASTGATGLGLRPAAEPARRVPDIRPSSDSPAVSGARRRQQVAVGTAVALGMVLVGLFVLRPASCDADPEPEGVNAVPDPTTSTAGPEAGATGSSTANTGADDQTDALPERLEAAPEQDPPSLGDALAEGLPVDPPSEAQPSGGTAEAEAPSTGSGARGEAAAGTATRTPARSPEAEATAGSATASTTREAASPSPSSASSSAASAASASSSTSSPSSSSSKPSSSGSASESPPAAADSPPTPTGSQAASPSAEPVESGPRIIGTSARARTGKVDTSKAGVEVWLVGPKGRVSGGTLPTGTYTIRARFGETDVTAGSFTLGLGEELEITCSKLALRCKASPVQ